MGLPAVDVSIGMVFVSAIISTAIGFLWYGPFFGKMWMQFMGFTKKNIDKAKAKGMGKIYLFNFIATLVMVYVLAYFVGFSTATLFSEGMRLGFLVWLGFIAPVLLNSVLWENKPGKLYLLNVGFWLINLVVIGGVLAVWG